MKNVLLFQERLLVRKALERYSVHLCALATEASGDKSESLLADARECDWLEQRFKYAESIVLTES
ncbi:MAG TPA: hypothetical protein V6D22_17010 [Candidatus Obscuribacterales bacterium]